MPKIIIRLTIVVALALYANAPNVGEKEKTGLPNSALNPTVDSIVFAHDMTQKMLEGNIPTEVILTVLSSKLHISKSAVKEIVDDIRYGKTATNTLSQSSTLEKGVLNDANWTQPKTNSSEIFTMAENKQTYYTNQFGIEINTVDDLANAIKSGKINVNDVPVDYIVNENGTKLILNTRTSVALERAGIPKDQWVGRNQTNVEVPNMGGKTFNDLAQDQLKTNGLPMDGTSIPPKGAK